MKRRTVLAAVVLTPAWLRRAFADASLPSSTAGAKSGDEVELGPITIETRGSGDRRAPADVGRALRRAQTRGRPVAVIVVRADERAREQRAQLVGDYLRRGSAEQLAPLGGADVICATLSSLRRAGVRLPATLDDEALFVRVAPDGIAAAAHARATDADLARVAAAARALFPLDGKSREEVQALGRVARRLREGPLPGANWGYTEGCGYHTPADAAATDDAQGIGCGMGSMGGPARRFLAFYVDGKP